MPRLLVAMKGKAGMPIGIPVAFRDSSIGDVARFANSLMWYLAILRLNSPSQTYNLVNDLSSYAPASSSSHKLMNS